jgi:sestrin
MSGTKVSLGMQIPNPELLSRLLHVSSDIHDTNSELNENDMTPFLFSHIYEHDFFTRRHAVKDVVDVLVKAAREGRCEFLKAHVASVVRLIVVCPFRDVRDSFVGLLSQIKESLVRLGVKVPVVNGASNFLSTDSFYSVDTDDEEVSELYKEIFMYSWRVSNLDFLLAQHSSLYRKLFSSMKFIMRSPGSIPNDWRNYIAIMSLSRYQCVYLYQLQCHDFLINGGDPQWLEGIQNTPKKLQKLVRLNAVLAHQSYNVGTKHIEELCTGEDSWSIKELVLVINIMAAYRSLASLVFSLGVNPEVDELGVKDNGDPFKQISYESDSYEEGYVPLVDTLNDISDDLDIEEPCIKAFEDSEVPQQDKFSNDFSSCDEVDSILHLHGGYLPMMIYEDFRMNVDPILHIEDFSWNDDCYGFIRRYYGHLGNLLLDEFSHAIELSYNNVYNAVGVDTGPFRKSLWFYVHRVHGIFHDDFNYHVVNQCLSRALKSLTKKASCYPHMIESKDFDFGMKLHASEKIHIMFIVAEARKQAELLLGMKALKDYSLQCT